MHTLTLLSLTHAHKIIWCKGSEHWGLVHQIRTQKTTSGPKRMQRVSGQMTKNCCIIFRGFISIFILAEICAEKNEQQKTLNEN